MPLDGVIKKAPSAPPAPKPQPKPEPKKFDINKDSPIAGAENEPNKSQKKDSGNINAPKKEGEEGQKKSGDQRGESSQKSSDTPENGRTLQDEYNTGANGKPGLRERTENYLKNLPEKLKESGGNPQALVGGASDEILHTGEKLGHLLWLIWGVLSLVALFPIIIGAIPIAFIWNLLLVSPKTVYTITEVILDLTGFGEALQILDQVGITNVKITIKFWEKMLIVLYDAVVGFILFLICAAILAVFCFSVTDGSLAKKVVVGIVSPAAGLAQKFIVPQEIIDFCEGYLNNVSSTISGPSGGENGPIVASGCSNKESGGCTRANISICPEFAAQMENSLRACNQESQGGKVGIGSGTDQCYSPSGVVSFSWGLWQINVTDSSQPEFPECAGVLRKVDGPWDKLCLGGTCGRTCAFGPGGKGAFDTCVYALSDPVRNTRQACNLYNQRRGSGIRGWGPWPYTRKICRLP